MPTPHEHIAALKASSKIAADSWRLMRIAEGNPTVYVGWHPIVKSWIVEIVIAGVIIKRYQGVKGIQRKTIPPTLSGVVRDAITTEIDAVIDQAFRWCENNGCDLLIMNGEGGLPYSWTHHEKIKRGLDI